MTDAILVSRKLTLLREHIGRVQRRRPAAVDDFCSDIDLQDATAMSLLVATQEAVNIALHIAADEGWGVPSSYSEGFMLLATHEVFDTKLADDLGKVVAVRNRLAHGYASVDAARLWTEIPAGMDALERFCSAVAGFLPSDDD